MFTRGVPACLAPVPAAECRTKRKFHKAFSLVLCSLEADAGAAAFDQDYGSYLNVCCEWEYCNRI